MQAALKENQHSLSRQIDRQIVKSLSRVQLFATPWTSPAGSSVHGILQARVLEWVSMPFSRGSPDPGIQPMSLTSPALTGMFFTTRAIWELTILYLNDSHRGTKGTATFRNTRGENQEKQDIASVSQQRSRKQVRQTVLSTWQWQRWQQCRTQLMRGSRDSFLEQTQLLQVACHQLQVSYNS